MSDVKPIDRVRRLIDAECPVADAIRIVLGGSVPKWAEGKGLHRTPASMTISGRRVPPDSAVLQALATDLEASSDDVSELLAIATRQVVGAGV